MENGWAFSYRHNTILSCLSNRVGEGGGIDELEEVAWVLIKGGYFADERVLASFGDFHPVCDLMELCFLKRALC